MGPRNSESEIRNSALGIITRRDHSCSEMEQKLERKFPGSEHIQSCITWLKELSYLDDQHFAEMFVRSRLSRRRGPNRIKLEMQQKGLSGQIGEQALADAKVDWYELAVESHDSRFKTPPLDRNDNAKRYRYLQAQGFLTDHIQYALQQVEQYQQLQQQNS